jgi:hypothetical protein
MKKYSINIDGSLYEISASIADAFIRNNFDFQPCVKDGVTIFLLNSTDISFFQVVSTTSLSHFYIMFSGKKFRISGDLYSFLLSALNPDITVPEKKINVNKFCKTAVSPLT